MKRAAVGTGAFAVLLLLGSAAPSRADLITSTFGDVDCFNGAIAAPCDGLTGFIPGSSGDPDPTDEQRSNNSSSWTHTYAPNAGLTPISATLTIRTWDMGSCCGLDEILFNGTSIWTRADVAGPRYLVETFVIDIPLAALGYDGTELVMFNPSDGEVWGVDYSRLDIEAVPEPGTLLLIGSGLAGLAARSRRRPR